MIYKILFLQIAIASGAPSSFLNPLVITGGHCEKNISIKYQVPVTRNRVTQSNTLDARNEVSPFTRQYIDYEERTRLDTVTICCEGYRKIIFGLCEPICEDVCPEHSYCIEPKKCDCEHGYEASHHPNKEHQLICRPICFGGCPEHSHCVAPNKCECRGGFKDSSAWYAPLQCDRIQCPAADQRYDIVQHSCIKIEMSVEELMQRVGEKLAHGLDATTSSFESDEDT